MRSGCLSQHGTPADGALLAHAAAAARQRNGAPVGVLTDHVAAVRVSLQPLRSALNTSAGRQTRAASAPGRTVQARLTRSAVLKEGSAILNSSSQAHMLHGEPVMGSLQCLGQTLLLAHDEYYLAPAPPISWHKVAFSRTCCRLRTPARTRSPYSRMNSSFPAFVPCCRAAVI